MNLQNISTLIIEYRYAILIPLALIEGPVVAFIAGTLAALNYFNIYALLILFFIRDVGLDACYYAIGYYGGHSAFVRRMLSKIGVGENDLESIRKVWEKRPFITMLIGKLSYGIAQIFIIAAGTVKMRFRTFFTYGAMVAVLQFWTLIFLGYFFGSSFGGKITTVLNNIQYVLAAFGIVLVVYYVISWRLRKKFMKSGLR